MLEFNAAVQKNQTVQSKQFNNFNVKGLKLFTFMDLKWQRFQ